MAASPNYFLQQPPLFRGNYPPASGNTSATARERASTRNTPSYPDMRRVSGARPLFRAWRKAEKGRGGGYGWWVVAGGQPRPEPTSVEMGRAMGQQEFNPEEYIGTKCVHLWWD